MTQILTVNTNQKPTVRDGDVFVAAGSDLCRVFLPNIKFTKAGRWVLGSENTPVSETRLAADVPGAQQGYICFVDGNVVDEFMVPVTLGKKTSPDELPDHGPYMEADGWKPMLSVQLRSIETGEQFIYKTTSQGGFSAIGKLLTKYGYRRNIGKSGIPIVDLGISSYQHKRYGTVFQPDFRILSWRDEADLLEADVVKPSDELHDDEIPF